MLFTASSSSVYSNLFMVDFSYSFVFFNYLLIASKSWALLLES